MYFDLSVGIEPLKARHDVTKLNLTILCYLFGVLTLIWVFSPCLLHCTWLGWIRSYTKDTSHGFLVSRKVIRSWFIDLGNPVETIVHHFLIGGMTYLDHRDRFPMVGALVYVRHIGQDLWWLMIQTINYHDSLSYYTALILNLEKILSLCQNQ